MNAFASSECSSGCESGWTLYLEQSYLSPTAAVAKRGKNHSKHNVNRQNAKEESEEQEQEHDEEDLSMVSDASSGPPHFNEDESYFNYDNGCSYPAFKDATAPVNNGGKHKRQKERTERGKEHHQELPNSFLDDTASSPAFNLSKNNFSVANHNQASMESMLDYSQGFSATHFQERSAYQDHFGYVQPPLSGNQLHKNQWF
ncbi:protein SOB FIVE-LIKE 5 [Ricinus communis]|uniref:protein SOB FIVE-LIKE 5 n=1 Tax=Ricinus communis TaxID=3988 RepID=UPI0007721B79|nr:protein SOB FIVE-LIKE 5 [Ricinus communis]|eukprot:XP_002522145.2 uncharacterized protein LOC8273857 [Ricinus communis]